MYFHRRGVPGDWRVFVGLVLLLTPVARAQDEQRLREREVLDPARDEWVPREAAPEVGIDAGRANLARGESDQAYRTLKDWVRKNPEDARQIEGVYLLGEAYFQRKWYYQAYEQWDIVTENTAGDLFYLALRRQMDVARALLAGEKRILWGGLLRVTARDEGVKILDRIWERAPGTSLGELALRTKADYYFERGDLMLAQQTYATLAQEYPESRFARAALLRSAEAAGAAFGGVKFDDRPLLDADERYAQLQASYPDFAEREGVATRRTAIREQRAQKDLEIARWYQRTRQTGAAEFYYRGVVRDYRDTTAAQEAQQALRALGIDDESAEVGT